MALTERIISVPYPNRTSFEVGADIIRPKNTTIRRRDEGIPPYTVGTINKKDDEYFFTGNMGLHLFFCLGHNRNNKNYCIYNLGGNTRCSELM